MNRFSSAFVIVFAVVALILGGSAFGAGKKASATGTSASGSPAPGDKQVIRLFREVAGEKKYFTGFDWLQLDVNQKIILVERARQGALQMSVVMTLPAEVYVKEIDRMFNESTEIRYIELGQAIEGIAIALKDWDDGREPEKVLSEASAGS